MSDSSTVATTEAHKPRRSSWLLPLLAAFLAFLTSPICIIHFCSAGSRVFEVFYGVAVTVAAGVLVARSATKSRRILITVLAPIASIGLTMLYFTWIHSSRISAASDLKERDATLEWSYPYTAPAAKEKRIRDGMEALLKGPRGTPVSKAIDAFGPPDEITDMSKGFIGMSTNEDGMLVQSRQYLSHRLVWYMKKRSANGSSMDDTWFAAYVGKNTDGSDGILKVMRHNFK